MTKNQAIVKRVLELTNSGKISWRNYKDLPPKATLDNLSFARVKIATKFPKRLIPVTDGYNKYQSYYALNDKLVLSLTKGKRDDRILLIAGEVNLSQPVTNNKNKFKRNQFEIHLTVFTDSELDGKLTELHQVVHQTSDELPYSDSDVIDLLDDNL